MPDKRKHRGPSPEDARLFGPGSTLVLNSAVADMSLLLSRGYAEKSTLKLVGDRFSLTNRQRIAVMRCACSDHQLNVRCRKQADISVLSGSEIVIDGFNLLITLEALLSGAPVFIGRDGCFRDISGIHGSYRKVSETLDALYIIADYLANRNVKSVLWMFDRPVSNSGKLKVLINELAAEKSWPWHTELALSPDKELIATDKIVITSDSGILDNCSRWVNLVPELIEKFSCRQSGELNIIDLSCSDAG